VNLERPQRRSDVSFDYEDELLDVWIAVGHEPELVDEDELDEAVARSFVTVERAAAIRATAEQILAEPPWPTGWEEWRPEPGWQRPTLPPNWSKL
jgi:predicted RNA-binding protein associated with RNAse of E/G family